MTTTRLIGALRINILWALSLAMCGLAHGQEISQPYPTSPQEFVSYLFRHYEIVADGEFYSFPEYSEAELRLLKREDAFIKFRIHKWYKGPVRESFDIRLANEMLVFPGEDISRFEKKHQILDKQDEDLELLLQEYSDLQASYEAGEADEAAYRARVREISKLMQERINRDGLADLARRYIGTDHSKTFFDLGGVIRPGERYLIAFDDNPEGSGVCVLDPFLKFGKLYWGELRAHVLRGFETLILTPPGNGDASNAQQPSDLPPALP